MFSSVMKCRCSRPSSECNVTDVNRFGVSLTWEPPEYDGGAEITNYVIEELRDKTSIRWETAMTVRPKTCLQLSLMWWKDKYSFEGQGSKPGGVGKPSAATPFIKVADPIGKFIQKGK